MFSDFDPTVDPVEIFKKSYVKQNRLPENTHKLYQNGPHAFVAPLLRFQRPTVRFDEAALFDSCQSSLRLFAVRAEEAFGTAAIPSALQQEVRDARWFADAAEDIGEGWFGLSDQKGDSRNTFTGIMTRDTYTKAAHLALLRVQQRVGVFRSELEQFRQSLAGRNTSDWEMLELFVERKMEAATIDDGAGNVSPAHGSTFRSAAFPKSG